MEMTKFYGQHNPKEDFILYNLFKDKKIGFYIDIGAYDGIDISNTFIFDQLGWKGLCFEPHPRHFIDLIKNRSKNSICCDIALSDKISDGEKFWLKPRVSTLNPKVKKSDWNFIYVKTTTLNEILKSYEEKIDFITIDVEGHEQEVLNGFNIKKYLPDIVLIETKAKGISFNYDDYFMKNDYKKLYTVKINDFWCPIMKYDYYSKIIKNLKLK